MITEPVSIRRGLSLYKQPIRKGAGSPNYYSRVYMPIGGRAYHVRSTRTTDLRVARQRAEEHFADCLLKQRYGDVVVQTLNGKPPTIIYRFDKVADDWLKQKEREAGSDVTKLRGVRDARTLLEAQNGLNRFFKKMDVKAITTDTIRAYLQFTVDGSKRGALAPTTKRKHLSVLSPILRFAYEKRLIPSIPLMPRVRTRDNPRGWFNPTEYRLLRKMAGVLARRCRKFGQDSAAADWLELEEFIIFMVGTFLRPSEWKLLRQKDISIHKGEHPHLQIAVSNGKTKMRKVISMPSVVGMYERKVRREGIDPERYLFKNQYPNRATAYERMADSFNRLLDETGLGPDEFGRKRTLYSLRHTALMLRLLNGDNVDLLTLAKNAGTSVSQLERFYCSHIDPAMKIANLQSFRFGGSR